MANDSKDVELRIRARDYSQKTLEGVVDAIKALVDAQGKQLDSAKKGETGAKALADSYDRLENAAKALLSQNALIKNFEAQNAAFAETVRRVDAARQAQSEYARVLASTAKITKEQERSASKLANAVVAAEKAQLTAQDRVAATTAKMAAYGIAVDNVAAAQRQIFDAVQVANGALDRQDAAMSTLAADTRVYQQSQEDAAKATAKLANAERQRQQFREAIVNQRIAEIAQQEVVAQNNLTQATERLTKQRQQFTAAITDQRIAEIAQREALNKAADSALAAAKGYSTLARSVKDLRGGSGLADQIRGIADPAAEALKTLGGLDAAVAALERRAAAATGPVKGFKEAMLGLSEAQRSISAIAGQVDSFRRSMTAVRDARQEYVEARTAVQQLAQQMRESGGNAGEFAQQMASAQGRLKAAANEMGRQVASANAIRTALRAAGVDTRNLATAEAQLMTQAQRTTNAVDTLTAAFRKYGSAAEASSKFTFFKDGRTTLSLMQRMKGELLGLASAYVGVQAAVNLASSSLAAFRSKQTIESRLAVMVGNDAKLIRDEWDFLMGQANRLGFEFEKIAASYAKFGIAAKSVGVTSQETRFIFEQMAIAARGARLTADDFDGVLKALEQMMSKGTIQAEELRGQLGDRLPGAFAMAAEGAGKTVQEFSKMLELGEVTSDFVINLARVTGKRFGAVQSAVTTLADAEGRMANAAFQFRLAMAEGGFVDAYVEFLEKLTTLLKSTEGKQFAQTLSDGFTLVVRAMQWAAENVDTLKIALSALIGLGALKFFLAVVPAVTGFVVVIRGAIPLVAALWRGLGVLPAAIGGIGVAAGATAGGVATLTTGIGLLSGALKILARSIPVIGAAIVAYEVYDALRGKEGDAERAGTDAGKEFAKGFTGGATGEWEDAGAPTPDPGTGGSMDDFALRAVQKTLDAQAKKTAKQTTAARMKGAKGALQERLDIAAEPFEQLKQQAEATKVDAKDRAEVLIRIEKEKNAALAAERLKFNNEQVKSDEGAASKRANLAREVADEIARIEDDLAKRATEEDPTKGFDERLRSRVEAIAHEYDKLGRKIDQLAKFDPAGAASAREKLGVYIKQRQAVETIRAKQDELQRLEGELNTQTSLRSTLLAKVQAQFEAGALTQGEVLSQTLQINTSLDAGITKAGQSLKAFAESMRELLSPAQFSELMARVDTVMVQNAAGALNGAAQLEVAERRVNDLLAQRQIELEAINQQRQLGLITNQEEVNNINLTTGRFKQQIIDSAMAVEALALSLRNPANAAAMDALIAQMRLLATEAQHSKQVFTEIDYVIATSFVGNALSAIESVAQAFGEVVVGQKSVAQGFKDMGRASLQFFAQFLRDIAMAILKQMLLNALQNSGNPYLAAIGAAGASVRHGGGLVNMAGNRRRVDPSWFIGAQRLHGGGMPGLQSNEMPTILERSEEVLTRDDPRHVLNGGAGGGGGGSSKFVLVDDRSKIAEAMLGQEGEDVTMVHLRRNVSTLRQWLK